MGNTNISQQGNRLAFISVIIPTYNADKFIEEALDSVLSQTYRMFEVIVIDDGSTDNTKEILRKFDGKIRYFFQENRGPAAARNAGIKVAKGEYICFLDADDLWVPNKLEVQLQYMDCHPNIPCIFSDHKDFKEGKTIPGTFLGDKKAFQNVPIEEGVIENAFIKLLQENFISTPTVMLKREVLGVTGLFDEDLWSVEDRDLWIRLAANFSLACVPQILCKRRVHQSNISRQSELAFRNRIKVIEKNKRQFSSLAPGKIWHSELADSYCRIGYLFLEKGQRLSALQSGFVSLAHAVRGVFAPKGVSPYPWGLGVGLIPAAILGWQRSRGIFRWIKKYSEYNEKSQ